MRKNEIVFVKTVMVSWFLVLNDYKNNSPSSYQVKIKKNDISKEKIKMLEETRDVIYADLMRDSIIWQNLSCTELLK